MKNLSFPKTALFCAAIVVSATWFVGAGPPSLTPPPGPITESGRFGTRCDVLSLPGDSNSLHVIDQPGSYYLSGNINGQPLKNGIEIAAHDVTLDLNGFQLIGGIGSENGIHMSSFHENVVIKNGGIRDWDASGMTVRIVVGRVEGIVSSRNLGWGIRNEFGSSSTKILNCEVLSNGNIFDTTVAGGINCWDHAMIKDCHAIQNYGDGIRVGPHVNVLNCVVTSNSRDGIQHRSDCLVRGCLSRSNVGLQYNDLGSGSVLLDNN